MADVPNYTYRGLSYTLKKMGAGRNSYYLVRHNGQRIANALSKPHAKTLARVHADGLLGLSPKHLPR